MKFEIWQQGYLVTGMEGIPAPAVKLGEVEAATFAGACAALCSPQEWQKKYGYFDAARLTLWGCRLFDNEQDARRAFG